MGSVPQLEKLMTRSSVKQPVNEINSYNAMIVISALNCMRLMIGA